MLAAFVQTNPWYLAVEENLARVERLLADESADLYVLPELFATGYFFHSRADLESVAEPIEGGATCARLIHIAKQKEAVLVAGLAERDGANLYNSAVVVTPEGVLGVYRKIHLFYEEKLHFTPGDLGFRVFDVTDREGKAYRLGVMICFDWYFPEAARSLALQGADVIAHPANLVRPDCPRTMPIRALENHVYTVTANRFGHEARGEEVLSFIGRSSICSPEGEVLLQAAPSGETVGCTPVDPGRSRVRRINAFNDLFADRRPDTYFTGGR